MENRLDSQMRFIIEIDKVKHVLRRTRLFDGSRHENDAEHSWHLAMMALTLGEYADEEVDVGRVIKMVLVHDVVEADAGDTFLYDETGNEAKRRKRKRLRNESSASCLSIRKRTLSPYGRNSTHGSTADARFAAALDRLRAYDAERPHPWLRLETAQHQKKSGRRQEQTDRRGRIDCAVEVR